MANGPQANCWRVGAVSPPLEHSSLHSDVGWLLAALLPHWAVCLSLSGELSLGASAEALAKTPLPGIMLRRSFLFSFLSHFLFFYENSATLQPWPPRILWASLENSGLPQACPLWGLCSVSLPSPHSSLPAHFLYLGQAAGGVPRRTGSLTLSGRVWVLPWKSELLLGAPFPWQNCS